MTRKQTIAVMIASVLVVVAIVYFWPEEREGSGKGDGETESAGGQTASPGQPPSLGSEADNLASPKLTGLQNVVPVARPDVSTNPYSLMNADIPLYDGDGISEEVAVHLELSETQKEAVGKAVIDYNTKIGEQMMTTAVREVTEDNSVSKWTVPPFLEDARQQFRSLDRSVRSELSKEKADALVAGVWGHLLNKAFFEVTITIDKRLEPHAALLYERRDPKTGRRNASWSAAIETAEERLGISVDRLP